LNNSNSIIDHQALHQPSIEITDTVPHKLKTNKLEGGEINLNKIAVHDEITEGAEPSPSHNRRLSEPRMIDVKPKAPTLRKISLHDEVKNS